VRESEDLVDEHLWVATFDGEDARVLLVRGDVGDVSNALQTAVGEQCRVDGGRRPSRQRVGGRPQGDGLTFHHAAGAEDEVRGSDQADAVDGAVGQDQTGRSKGGEAAALVV